jgi:hypothetical protein
MDISWWNIVLFSDSPAVDDDHWCNKNASQLPPPAMILSAAILGGNYTKVWPAATRA